MEENKNVIEVKAKPANGVSESSGLQTIVNAGETGNLPTVAPQGGFEKGDLMPIVSVDEALDRYNQILEFTKRLMIEGEDYGEIMDGGKPTLLKAGAEKLCNFFGFSPVFVPMNSVYDWDKGFFHVTVMCGLYKGGRLIATSFGSCNSKEQKYRYRKVMEWEATDEQKANAIKQELTKPNKDGRQYIRYYVENPEPYELVNTIEKMAQKRALVAATLLACNVSKIYTQDIEDMTFAAIGDGNGAAQPKRVKAKAKPAATGEAGELPPTGNPSVDYYNYAYGTCRLTQSDAQKVLDDNFGNFENALTYLQKSYGKNQQAEEKAAEVEAKPKVTKKE